MSVEKISEESVNQIPLLQPFVFSFPKIKTKHHEILNNPKSIKMRSGLITLQPGQECSPHNTSDNEELLIILQGSGEVKLDGFGIEKIYKDCTLYIPPKTQHHVINNEQQVLQYIYVVSKVGN